MILEYQSLLRNVYRLSRLIDEFKNHIADLVNMILCIYRKHDTNKKGKAINHFKSVTQHLQDKDLVDGHWSVIEITQYLYGVIHHYINSR